jgi:hypothetical protein
MNCRHLLSPSVTRVWFGEQTLMLSSFLGVTKFICVTGKIWVTLCCATYIGLRRSTNPPEVKDSFSFGHRQGDQIGQFFSFGLLLEAHYVFLEKMK